MGTFISSAFFKTFHEAGKNVSINSYAFAVAAAVSVLQFLAMPVSLLLDKGSVGRVIAQALQVLAGLRMDEILGPSGFLVLVVIVSGVPEATGQAATAVPCRNAATFRTGHRHFLAGCRRRQ